MRITGVEASRWLRCGVIGLLTVSAVAALSMVSADARGRAASIRSYNNSAEDYSPRYADIVVDGNSGAVLYSTNPDSQRHPASLTKIMTLYLLFERLEAGKLKLNSALPVSAHASTQAPSKLGLKPGQSIVVEDAIKAIVTRSANDVAVVIAEALGGDEDSFAQLMTRKARALGMAHTVYINASGLPDDDQITTARDQALLGRAIQDHFPQYYGYFSTSSFRYRGSMIGNHNRLLNQVAGVDGIKTGYIRASGFNLVTSVRRGGRQLVAVVLGGRTAGLRDARMRELIEDYIVVASNKRTAPMIAEAAIEPAPPRRTPMQRIAAAVITPAKADTAPTTATIPSPVPATGPTAALGSTDPLLPLLVKTVAVRPGTIKTASLGPLSATESNAHAVLPVRTVAEPQPEASLPLPAPTPGTHGISPAKLAAAAPPPAPVLEPAPPAPSSAARAGWMIQVGAFDQETEAKQRLNSAQSRAKTLLGAADPFTERVTKGDKTLYRARFAGLDKDRAEAACQYLKKNEIACMALKN